MVFASALLGKWIWALLCVAVVQSSRAVLQSAFNVKREFGVRSLPRHSITADCVGRLRALGRWSRSLHTQRRQNLRICLGRVCLLRGSRSLHTQRRQNLPGLRGQATVSAHAQERHFALLEPCPNYARLIDQILRTA